MAHIKRVAFSGKYTNKSFNDAFRVLFGNGRIRGGEPQPNASNSLISLTLPLHFIYEGTIVEVTGIDVGVEAAAYPLPVSGSHPFAIVAHTQDANEATPVTISLVSDFDPLDPPPGTLLAYTDPATPGTKWISTPAIGIQEVLAAANTKQLTDPQLNILAGANGNIGDANSLHIHAGLINNQVVFETLTNLNYKVVPHTPLPRAPVAADALHSHTNIPTDKEINDLTSRGGIGLGDEQHSHKNLPSDAQFAAVFGGSGSDGDPTHSHPGLANLHGIVANPRPTIYYAPQNIGTGAVFVDATDSSFQGSVEILLGHADGPLFIPTTGVNAIVGIRYKTGARYFFDEESSAFGNCGPGAVGAPVQEQLDAFGADSVSGITSAVPFNTEFKWNGVRIKSVVPSGARAFDPEDFFSYHGIVSAQNATSHDGQPNGFKNAHERFLSYAGIVVAVVLDRRFVEGGYFTIPYL